MKTMDIKIMLKSSCVILSILSFSVFSSENCLDFSGCERKSCEIEQKIQEAELSNNQNKIKGLKVALAEVKSSCSNINIKDELSDEIKEVQNEIARYNVDLEEAKKIGKETKVKKYQNKIKEEERKLELLLQELSELDE